MRVVISFTRSSCIQIDSQKSIPMNRKLTIIPGFSGYKKEAVCFNTNPNPLDVLNPDLFVFGKLAPNIYSPSPIRIFYERLALGENFPSEMILSEIYSPDTILASTLFIRPDLVFESETSSLVYSVELFTKWGSVALAHIPENHANLLRSFSTSPSISLEGLYKSLTRNCSVIENYLVSGHIEGFTPKDSFEIIMEKDTFIAVHGPSVSWDSIYKRGFLWGVRFLEVGDFLDVLVFKKSSLVSIDLVSLGESLNMREFGTKGQGVGWLQHGSTTSLTSPKKNLITQEPVSGSSLSKEVILDILLT